MDKREEIVKCIRSCLISIKQKCNVKELRNDFQTITGKDIPYKSLGYNNINEFLYSIPTLTVTKDQNGQYMIEAKSDEKSEHIKKLVRKQKTTKKPTRAKINTNNYYKMSSKWRPTKVSNWKGNYKSSTLPQTLLHNQFVAPSPKKEQQKKNQRIEQKTDNKGERSSHREDLRSKLNAEKLEKSQHDYKQDCKEIRNGNKTSEGNFKNDLPPRFKKAVSLGNESRSIDDSSKISGSTQSRSKFIQKKETRSESDTPSPTFSFQSNPSPTFNSNGSMNINSIGNLSSRLNRFNCEGEKTSFIVRNNSWNGSEIDLKQKSQNFQRTGDDLVDLYTFIKTRNLSEPIFKTITRITKQKKTYYDCHLRVDTHSYSSYPNDFLDELSAKRYTAKLALEDLMTKYGKNQSLLLSTGRDILERIPPIVEKHYHGIWSWQLEADYIDEFNEQLPKNWLDIVNTSPFISVEPVAEKFVLTYCKFGEKGKKNNTPLNFEVSIPLNTIKFNEDETLIAEITCFVSAKEIWCRQLNTPEAEAFMEMNNFLDSPHSPYRLDSANLKAKVLTPGGYYIAEWINTFFRVRILEIFDMEVRCFFVDFGDDYNLSKDSLYVMKREFARDQAQAFICRLAGLEDLYDFPVNSAYAGDLIGKVVQIERDISNTNPEENDPILNTVMYDIEKKMCLNQELIQVITIESATPVLSNDVLNEVYVSNVEENGDVYVQVHSPGFETLQELLGDLEQNLLETPLDIKDSVVTPENSKERLYLAKYKEDGHWYRVKIIDWQPKFFKYAQIYYVDYGNTEVITINEETLYPLDEVSDIITQYPPQAVKVKMVIDIVPSNFKEKFKNLVSFDEAVFLSVVEVDKDNIPRVKFFKRSEPNNALFSINEAICMDSVIRRGSGDGNNNTNNKIQKLMSFKQFEDSSKNVPSTGELKFPPIPEIGECFDVIIPFAVNPWNFFVQPYESGKKLLDLMTKLQSRYGKDMQNLLLIKDIEPGKIYASKHEDGYWYRTSVIKIIHPGSISVFYCDYGYYSNLTLQQIFPLDPEFMELPFQAIKAKLCGIKPKNGKWTMEDCDYFKKLVVKKAFVSILMSKEKDEFYRSDTVLNLKLIDASSEVNKNISNLLIEKNIAIDI